MDIVKSAKEIGSDIEKGVEVVANKVADTFDNLASHLPFSNLAKREDSSFILPIDSDEEGIKSNYENGVLKISIPKKK